MVEKRQVKAGVGIQALALLKNARYTTSSAIAEYVDNSIASYIKERKNLKKINPNYSLNIDIIKNGRELIIKDNAGGISDKDYDRAFELADPPEDTSKLNEFGFGMKGASYWWTDKWSVATKHHSESFIKNVEFDYKKIMRTKAVFADAELKYSNNNKSFTILTIHKMDKPITKKERQKIIDSLSSSYRFYICLNEVNIRYIDKELNFKEILEYKNPPVKIIENIQELKDNIANKNQGKPFTKKVKKIKWFKKINFKFNKNKFEVKGEVGILETMKVEQSGFFYFRRGRLIETDRPQNIFTLGPGSAQSKSLFGVFTFDGVPTVIDKSALSWTAEAKEEFEHKIFKELRDKSLPILSMSNVPGVAIDAEKDKLFGVNKNKDIDPINIDVMRNSTVGLRVLDEAKKQGFKFDKIPKINEIDTSNSKPMVSKTTVRGIVYKCKHIRDFDPKKVDPWLTYYPGEKKGKEVNFAISISVKHPLINDYMNSTRGLVALELIAAYIVISEIYSTEYEKSNKASDIRDNINLILKELPPKGIFEN